MRLIMHKYGIQIIHNTAYISVRKYWRSLNLVDMLQTGHLKILANLNLAVDPVKVEVLLACPCLY